MGKSIGVKQFLAKKYKTVPIPKEWIEIIGEPEKNFKALIWGPSANGKTTYVLRLAKMLSKYGKVYYCSSEEGDSKSLQDAILRVDFSDCHGDIVFGNRDTFDELVTKLGKNRALFVVIDSVQYMELTIEQYKFLTETFKNKAFVLVSWADGKEPQGATAKAMKYRADIKTFVKAGVAHNSSRYGKTKPFKIFDDPMPGEQAEIEEVKEPPIDQQPEVIDEEKKDEVPDPVITETTETINNQ